MSKQQLAFLNNLKWFLVILVVIQHAAGAYTIGESAPITEPDRIGSLKPLLSINATFFMGLFFFISAYFVPNSLQKYNALPFIKGKIKRLLIPALIGIVLVLPITFYATAYPENFISFIQNYLFKGFTFGHMWFLVQLFIYMFVAAVTYASAPDRITYQADLPLTHKQVIGFIIYLSILTYCVGIVSPINQWYLCHTVEPYHLPQYIMLFMLGIMANQRNWLNNTSKSFGLIWLGVALLAIAYKVIEFNLGISHNLLSHVAWTSVQCASLCISFVVLFREYANISNRLFNFLSGNAYAVYIFHVPIVIWLQLWLMNASASPMSKFLVTLICGYIAANIFCAIIRKLPLFRSII